MTNGQSLVWARRLGADQRRAAYELPLETCIKTLGLSAGDFLSGPECTSRFGDQSSWLGGIADYRHVVCEIEDAEAAASGWKLGYCRAGVSAAQAIDRLGPPRKPWET